MGRKGVSKRKPKQTRSKSSSTNDVNGNESAVIRVAESQPVKTPDSGKVGTRNKSDGEPSSDRKKKQKKG